MNSEVGSLRTCEGSKSPVCSHLKLDQLSIILQSNWNEITDNFDDMNLKETLLRGIYAYGFEKPSAIQQRAIIPCIKGTNKFRYI